jgi:hypothetical protein
MSTLDWATLGFAAFVMLLFGRGGRVGVLEPLTDIDVAETRGDCAAYTVAELGAMLPRPTRFEIGHVSRTARFMDREAKLLFVNNGITEAEARAALLIALIKRGVVKFEAGGLAQR